MPDALFRSLLEQPTAPFREDCVRRTAEQWMDKHGIPHFRDPIGNLVVGAASKRELFERLRKKTKEPVRLFMAHMDHPGFHLTGRLSQRRWSFRWHGGGPVRRWKGSKVWLADSSGYLGSGKIQRFERKRQNGELLLDEEIVFKTTDVFGGLAFRRPLWKSGSRYYTKAADDLVGVYAILKLAQALRKKTSRSHFLGLLTRAEEVGFIGAQAHFQLGWLEKCKRGLVILSLEASRSFPGAEFGLGPVVRLGDRAGVFDPGGLQVLLSSARRVLKDRFQQRLMDGGTCEASVAMACGLTAVGICVPLGNYHNRHYEGGPDSRGQGGPAPEFVHENDVKGMNQLCLDLMKPGLPWSEPFKEKQKALRNRMKRMECFL